MYMAVSGYEKAVISLSVKAKSLGCATGRRTSPHLNSSRSLITSLMLSFLDPRIAKAGFPPGMLVRHAICSLFLNGNTIKITLARRVRRSAILGEWEFWPLCHRTGDVVDVDPYGNPERAPIATVVLRDLVVLLVLQQFAQGGHRGPQQGCQLLIDEL